MTTLKLTGLKPSAGFTLIEALVTVAIMGILTSIAVPSFNSFILGQRVKTAQSDLYSALVMARSEAMKRNATVTINQATGGWANGWSIAAGGAAILTEGIEKSVAIVELGSGLTSIGYSWTGRPTTASANATFVISASGVSARCITLTLSGLPRMLTDADGNAANGC